MTSHGMGRPDSNMPEPLGFAKAEFRLLGLEKIDLRAVARKAIEAYYHMKLDRKRIRTSKSRVKCVYRNPVSKMARVKEKAIEG